VKERWNCPKCDNTIVIHVKLETPPVCHNKKSHTSKPQEMEKESDANRNV
jgi:hypothetical protein